MATSGSVTTRITLTDIPFEHRLQIFHYCIPRKRVIDVRNPDLYPMSSLVGFGEMKLALLAVSK